MSNYVSFGPLGKGEAPEEPKHRIQMTTPPRSWRTWNVAVVDEATFRPPGRSLHFSLRSDWVEFNPVYALASVTARIYWQTPILRAEGPPTWSLGGYVGGKPRVHGIYSYKNLYLYARHYSGAIYTGTTIVGELENMGHIIEHTWGYRSEIVRIRRLFIASHMADRCPGIVSQFEDRYQCPVGFMPDPMDFEQQYGGEPFPTLRRTPLDRAACDKWADIMTKITEER